MTLRTGPRRLRRASMYVVRRTRSPATRFRSILEARAIHASPRESVSRRAPPSPNADADRSAASITAVSRKQEIVTAARREASDLDDEAARAALLLRTKRDLYLLAFDGVVDLLKRSEAPDTGAILEAIRDIFSDICDDWRDLAQRARRDATDAADADRRAAAARNRAEASMAELYAAAKTTEADLRRVAEERDALANALRDARAQVADAKRLRREAIVSAKARESAKSRTNAPGLASSDAGSASVLDVSAPSAVGERSDSEPRAPNLTRRDARKHSRASRTDRASSSASPWLVDSEETKRREAARRLEARLEYRPPPGAMPSYGSGPGSPATDSTSESASDRSPVEGQLERRDRGADVDAAVAALRVSNSRDQARSPVAPSTASPSARRTSARARAFGVPSHQSARTDRPTRSRRTTTPFDASFAENKPPPRWAIDTASVAAAAAAARGLGRGGAGQFGPDKSMAVVRADASPRPKQLPAFGDTSRARAGVAEAHLRGSGSLVSAPASSRSVSTRARRGSFPGRASPGSADGSGSEPLDARASARGPGGHPSAASSPTVASARPWTLRQLREVVEEIVAAKTANDARQAKRKKPRETMREHVYTFLNHKFGVKAVIAEWAESIAAATERFAGVDCEMAVFDRITRNVLDEEYFQEQRVVADTIEELLRSYVRSKLGRTVSDEKARAAFAEKKAGDLYDEEWLDMCRFMYGGHEMAGVVAAARAAQRANEIASYDEELERLVEENAAVGTRRRSTADLEAEARTRARKRLPYKDFVQTCLFHGLGAHEDALAPVVETLRELGVLRDGFMSEALFAATCERARPDLTDAQIEKLVLKLDPWNSGRITCSECYAALVPGLGAARDRTIGRGLRSKEESKTSLGGVGHGALFVPSYDGNVFGAK